MHLHTFKLINIDALISLIFIVAFVLCFAISISCILIAHEMANNYKGAFHRSYLYYLLAFYVFAIYAIWGQIGMHTLMVSVQTTGEVKAFAGTLMPIFGVPFLIVSMLMFIRMGFTLVDNSTKDYALQLHLIIFSIIVMVAVGLYWINKEAVLSIKTGPYYLIVLLLCIEFIYMVFFMGIVIRRLRKVGRHTQNIIRQFILLILAGLLLRGVSLAFHAVANWALPLLILIYFLSPFMAMWYLRQHSDIVFEPLSAERPSSIKKIQLYQKFNITPREQEVIEQLSLGKTNQQIADTLFISLQTVKDHTHRIYNKVGINSRLKLVRMIND